MKLINDFYKTKNLYKNGIFIFAFIALVTIGSFFIPEFQVEKQNKQLFSINGLYIKHGEEELVSHYFHSIKNNNGVLILGTSESGRYIDGNYFDFLNNDPDLKQTRFSVIGGAGRTCGIHIPTFLKHREDLKGLPIIYFINPIYWRTELAKVSLSYWDRDHNYKELLELNLTEKERKRAFGPVQTYFDELPFGDKLNGYCEQLVYSVRKKYYQDLNYKMNPEKYYDNQVYLAPNEGNLDQFRLFGQIDLDAIDTNFGVTHEFYANKSYYRVDTTTNYRYEELEAFARLCKDLNIDITFIVGPYNKRFIEHNETSVEYEKVVQNIKNLLKKNEANYIDASGISDKAGAFRDLQHHSSYGGYLIYQIIKKEYCEKRHL